MNEKNILIICEGEKAEPNLFSKIWEIIRKENVGIYNYNIVSYCTNIYSLGNYLRKHYSTDGRIDVDLFDTVGLINEIRSASLSVESFTDIVLVFDYDPHAPDFDSSLLVEMQEVFNESTYNGKLYLNYPMLESLYHHTSLDDKFYCDLMIELEVLESRKYKELVSDVTCFHNQHSKLTVDQISYLIKSNLTKLLRITKSSEVDLELLLKLQLQLLASYSKVFVINTSCLFWYDYSSIIFAGNLA